MLNNVNTNVERIIAKIDNDFNPDNSDWIPRVAAWCIEAMQQINVLRKQRKKVKLAVVDRIAYSPCELNTENLVVYDSNGCKLKKANSATTKCCSPSTGKDKQSEITEVANTVSYINNNDAAKVPDYVLAETLNDKEWPGRYRVNEYNYGINKEPHNYVIIGNNKIELNYDEKCITVEYDAILTYISEIYNCELPVIPNNGLLIEAIAYYCVYKMLCRGYRHPVFNLQASQYGTNPYYIWTQLKEEARRSVINQGFDEDASKLFRSNFFINTYDPRN